VSAADTKEGHDDEGNGRGAKAAADKRDADYKVAAEKCDALSGSAKIRASTRRSCDTERTNGIRMVT
jgi:hypothetical protein